MLPWCQLDRYSTGEFWIFDVCHSAAFYLYFIYKRQQVLSYTCSVIRTCKSKCVSLANRVLIMSAVLCSSLEKGQPYIFRVGSGQVFLHVLVGINVVLKCNYWSEWCYDKLIWIWQTLFFTVFRLTPMLTNQVFRLTPMLTSLPCWHHN